MLLLMVIFMRRVSGKNLEIYDRVGGGDSFSLGIDLRISVGHGAAVGRRMRRSPWRACHDHSRGYDDGDSGRSYTGHEITNCAYCSLNRGNPANARSRYMHNPL